MGIEESFVLNVESAVEYLACREVQVGSVRAVRALAGGVSGSVVLVEGTLRRVVVKQARGQLLVEHSWYAKRERSDTEARALAELHKLTPAFTPELIDNDRGRFALTMTASPSHWQEWRSLLLGEDVGESAIALGTSLGDVLGTWHSGTAEVLSLAKRFDDYEALAQLRVQPFHRVVLAAHPSLAEPVEACISDLLTRRDCLVHGDFSPKNVMVDPNKPGRLWVLDFEVAHYGARVFDLAFLQCHLILKAVHRPAHHLAIQRIATAFMDAYRQTFADCAGLRLAWHVACLLLARIEGTSRVSYLNDQGRTSVRSLAMRVLEMQDPTIDDVWSLAGSPRT